MTSIEFRSNLIKTDVTAVKIIYKKYLLIGIGHAAYVYKIHNEEYIVKEDIFVGQKIHGFIPNYENNLTAIYGGKQVKIYETTLCSDDLSENESNILEFNLEFKNKVINVNDWIISIIWLKHQTQVAILTAHNVLQIWNVSSDNIINRFDCVEKCILYSGLLYQIKDYVIIMAGTAFSQVVLWNTQGDRVCHRICGHKGVIFSVSYCKEKNIIVTTSDDRSVRIWNILSKQEHNSQSIEYWNDCEIRPHITLFGHTARVMRNIISKELIVSIGEDGLMCLWNLKGDLVNKRKVCQNGILWCLDCDFVQNIIVTGGSNTSVMLHRGFFSDLATLKNSLEFPYENMVAKKVVLTARGNVACLTEQGHLLYYDFEMDEWSVKNEIEHPKLYICMTVSLCSQLVALASSDGHIEVFAETCKFDPNLIQCISEKIIDGRILSCCWVANRCLVVCDGSGEITIWGAQNNSCAKITYFILPMCKQRWLTSAALDVTVRFLLVGDRCGNLHLFQKGIYDSRQSLSKVHGNIGINMITIYDNKIITTGRDGSIRYFLLTMDSNSEQRTLVYMHNIKLPIEWIERFIDRDLQIVCGFRETNFNIWNIKERTIIMDINCGGGHRSWDIINKWLEYENKTQKIIRFIYIKNSTVQCINAKYSDVTIKSVIHDFHSKEVNCFKAISHFNLSNEKPKFISFSAGEDTVTNIAFSELCNENFSFQNYINVANHLSSIRCMYLLSLENECNSDINRHILFTAGGRAQICALWLEVHKNTDKPKIHCFEIANYMLKGTDLHRRKKGSSWKNVQIDTDAETRYMSLNCIPKSNYLLAGCSDGYLRIYKTILSKYKCNIYLCESLAYHNKCIMKVHSFQYNNMTIVLTLAVDGVAAFWNFSHTLTDEESDLSKLQPFDSLKIHKAGINSFDVQLIENEKSFVLATGGDDNVIHLNVLCVDSLENQPRIKRICAWNCDKYHCSQITGIKFLQNNILISTSIDQRITVLEWCFKENITVTFLRQYHSTVSDIQGLEILYQNINQITLCVYGKGIEIITIIIKK